MARSEVERAEIPERAWSTPWDAPAVPPFPISFRDVTVLTVCYRSHRAAIEQLVPAPLEVISDVVVAHIYRMPDVDFMGRVNECNVMVGVRLGADTTGGYTTAQYLDSPEGVAHGREVHGQPKKVAEGFANSVDVMQNALRGLVDAGVITRAHPRLAATTPNPADNRVAPTVPSDSGLPNVSPNFR